MYPLNPNMSSPPPPPHNSPSASQQRALPAPPSSGGGGGGALRYQQSQPYHQSMHFQAPTFMNVFCEPGQYSVQTSFLPSRPRNFATGGAYGNPHSNYFAGAGKSGDQSGKRGDFGAQSNWADSVGRMPFNTASSSPKVRRDYQNASVNDQKYFNSQ